MPIIDDIEPVEDDESAYRCWICGQLLVEIRPDRLCPECREAEEASNADAEHRHAAGCE